jgi:UDP-glucose 4-epimerase
MDRNNKKNILVAGGAGYIGSHMVRLLLEAGYAPVVFDNLSTGHREFIPNDVVFIEGDLRNESDLKEVFDGHDIDTVMHFASFIQVGESVKDPVKYYDNNVIACIKLLEAMLKKNVKKIVFSSTAAVYGDPEEVPVAETALLKPTNPYGRTKLMFEEILEDVRRAQGLDYISLRYFNVAGAHESGGIGENHDPETHLIPNILRSAKNGSVKFQVFGDDYSTPDGTCIRDYIHVVDLCKAHLLSLEYLDKKGTEIFNLGSGNGFSVNEVVENVRKVTEKDIMVEIHERRAGDAGKLVACSDKAKDLLGWEPEYGLEDMIRTAWEWEQHIGRGGVSPPFNV